MGRISEFAMHFLVNAAWQIAAIALGASVCAWLLRNVVPRYRHALWGASLVLSLALPIWGSSIFKGVRRSMLESNQPVPFNRRRL